MAIAVVLFDLGGVVCHFRPERRLAALAAASGLAAEEVHARIWGSGLDARCDHGDYSTDEAHRAISERLGLTLDPAALCSLWALAFEPSGAVLALIDAARSRVQTGLLTDNGPVLREAMPRHLPEVVTRFDWLFFSCELGALKPAPELFDRVLAAVGARAGDVLLIDDSERNVEGARACGLRAACYRDPSTLAEELARHGISATPGGSRACR